MRNGLAAGIALVLAPLGVLWFTLNPGTDAMVIVPNEHFYIVTLVSALAMVAASLVARSALDLKQFQLLLVALGFMTMSGFFVVHALHTPGVMFGHGGYSYTAEYVASAASPAGPIDYSGTIVGLSGFLSVFLAAFFFAASRREIAARIQRVISARALAGLVVAVLALYVGLSIWATDWLASMPFSKPPYAQALVIVAVVVLLYASLSQFQTFRRARRPMEGALARAFAFLAEAQAMMLLPPWSLMWWAYHLLMLAAVILALSALIIELERRRGLERFLPAEVVERVVSNDLLRLAGERRRITLLFADLRNSTTLAEQMMPDQVSSSSMPTSGRWPARCSITGGCSISSSATG